MDVRDEASCNSAPKETKPALTEDISIILNKETKQKPPPPTDKQSKQGEIINLLAYTILPLLGKGVYGHP